MRIICSFSVLSKHTYVNDPSERVVQTAKKQMKSVRSEGKFQDTLLTVHKLQLLSTGLKRDRFKKSELQKIVKKLMEAP